MPGAGRLGVDVAGALDLVGRFVRYLGLAFLVPAAVALGYGEPVWPFLASGAITVAAGWLLVSVTEGRQRIGVREGFLVVSLTWLLVPAFGSLPYQLADEVQLANPIDAYFEAVSGFTATGATVLVDVEALDRSLLFWRQFSQWLGGMGIVVLAIAVLPKLRVGGRQLLQSELAGPTELERLTVTIRETARRLWVLYVALTVAMVLVLAGIGWSGLDDGMGVFDAVTHAFTGVSIGGFSTRNDSLAAFGPAVQWATVAFLVIAGVNFLRLYRLFVQRQPRAVTRDEEFRYYLGFLVLGAALLVLELVGGGLFPASEGFRHAVVQAVSIMTTTGYSSADYTAWSALAQLTLLLLMLVGASAGSTGGAIKVVRHLLMAKIVRREIRQTIHRELVLPIRLSGAVVDERALRSVITFVALYLIILALGAVGLLIDATQRQIGVAPFDAIGAAASCLGNVGPAFGFAGPLGSYEPFSDLSTGILTGLMWLGRLEIVPVVVLLTRSYWRS
ncbi:MAG: TrkH family potassium uptake protein [Thermoleophilia bacterium]|nr:TrkH family potassium uptake protein [Thermoleophilia bacterium]